MPTPRLPSAILLTMALLGVIGCRDANELIRGRQLACDQTPEDTCIRVADEAAGVLREMRAPTVATMTVAPRTCDADELSDLRCWSVDVTYAIEGVNTVLVHEHADESLGIHHTSIGSPPDT